MFQSWFVPVSADVQVVVCCVGFSMFLSAVFESAGFCFWQKATAGGCFSATAIGKVHWTFLTTSRHSSNKFGSALDFSNVIEIQYLRCCRKSVLYQTRALLFMFDFWEDKLGGKRPSSAHHPSGKWQIGGKYARDVVFHRLCCLHSRRLRNSLASIW